KVVHSSPPKPVPKLCPHPRTDSSEENNARGTPPSRNLSAALHAGSKCTLRICDAHPGEEHWLGILQRPLRADYDNLPTKGPFRKAVKLQPCTLSSPQQAY